MKRWMTGAAAAMLVMLSGCSADETTATPEDLTPEQLANVEIRLSAQSQGVASAQVTRASVEGDGDMQGLGIFGLAREIQNVNQSPQPVTWYAASENWSGVILDNVKANKVAGDIEWADGQRYFYPITQFYSYDFYGYYPYSEEVTHSDTDVKVQYVIDGTQDLIWGRATSDETYAYSARYFRVSGNDDKKPNLDLKHLLTRLVFTVVPGESYEGSGDYSMATRMTVKELEIVDVCTNLTVTVADLNNLDMDLADRIEPSNDEVGVLTLFSVDDEGNKIELVPVTPTAPEEGATPEPQQLGESVMLYPADRYTIRIKVDMAAYTDDVTGEEVEAQEFISEVPLQLVMEGETFKQGVSYNVKITVHGPRVISLAASLTPWEEQQGPEIIL